MMPLPGAGLDRPPVHGLGLTSPRLCMRGADSGKFRNWGELPERLPFPECLRDDHLF